MTHRGRLFKTGDAVEATDAKHLSKKLGYTVTCSQAVPSVTPTLWRFQALWPHPFPRDLS